ncbi:MAG: hypothetical protein ACI9R3_004726 [Verrucomicrobiales bacterium]|jgi:hypothetical protein
MLLFMLMLRAIVLLGFLSLSSLYGQDGIDDASVEVFIFKVPADSEPQRLISRSVSHDAFLGQLMELSEHQQVEMERLVGRFDARNQLFLRKGENIRVLSADAVEGSFTLRQQPEEMMENVFVGAEVKLKMLGNASISVDVELDVASPQMVVRRGGLELEVNGEEAFQFITLQEPRYHRLSARARIPQSPAGSVYLVAAGRDADSMQPDGGVLYEHYVFVRIGDKMRADAEVERAPLYEICVTLFRIKDEALAMDFLQGKREPYQDRALYKTVKGLVADDKATVEALVSVTGADVQEEERGDSLAGTELARVRYDPGGFTDAGPVPGGDRIVVPGCSWKIAIGTKLRARVQPPGKARQLLTSELKFRHHLRAPERVWLKSHLAKPAEQADPESWMLQAQVVEWAGRIVALPGQPVLVSVQKIPELLAGQRGKDELLVIFARIDTLEPGRESAAIAASPDVVTEEEYERLYQKAQAEYEAAILRGEVPRVIHEYDPFADSENPDWEPFQPPPMAMESAQPFFTETTVFEARENLIINQLIGGTPAADIFSQLHRLVKSGAASLRDYSLSQCDSGARGQAQVTDLFPAIGDHVYYFDSFKHAPESADEFPVGFEIESEPTVARERGLIDINVAITSAPSSPSMQQFKVFGYDWDDGQPTHGRGIVDYAAKANFEISSAVGVQPGEVCLLGSSRMHTDQQQSPTLQLAFVRILMEKPLVRSRNFPRNPEARSLVIAATSEVSVPLLSRYDPNNGDEALLKSLMSAVNAGTAELIASASLQSRNGNRATLESGPHYASPSHFGASRVAAGTGWGWIQGGVQWEVDPVMAADGSYLDANFRLTLNKSLPLLEWQIHPHHPERTVDLVEFDSFQISGATTILPGELQLLGVVKRGDLPAGDPGGRFRFLFARELLNGSAKQALRKPVRRIVVELVSLRGKGEPDLNRGGIPDTHSVTAWGQVTTRSGQQSILHHQDYTRFLAANSATKSGELWVQTDQLAHGLSMKIEGARKPDGSIDVTVESLNCSTAAPNFPSAEEMFAHINREKAAGVEKIAPLPPQTTGYEIDKATIKVRGDHFHLLKSFPSPGEGEQEFVVIRARMTNQR